MLICDKPVFIIRQKQEEKQGIQICLLEMVAILLHLYIFKGRLPPLTAAWLNSLDD